MSTPPELRHRSVILESISGILVRMLLVVFTASWLFGQSLASHDLSGPVHRVRYTANEVQTSRGESRTVNRGSAEFDFDREGNLSSESIYGTDGKLESGRVITRSEKEYVETFVDSQTVQPSKYIWRYDDSGELVEMLQVENGEVHQREVIIRDGAGKALEKVTYGADGGLKGRVIFSDDDRANQFSREKYDAAGELIERQAWAQHGPVSTQEVFFRGAVVSRSVSVKEGASARTDHEVQKNPDGTVDDVLTKYDEEGRRTEEVVVRTGKVESSVQWATSRPPGRRVWGYDLTGKVVLEQHFDVQGMLVEETHTTYVCDEHGNWVKRIERTTGNEESPTDKSAAMLRTTTRAITYY